MTSCLKHIQKNIWSSVQFSNHPLGVFQHELIHNYNKITWLMTQFSIHLSIFKTRFTGLLEPIPATNSLPVCCKQSHTITFTLGLHLIPEEQTNCVLDHKWWCNPLVPLREALCGVYDVMMRVPNGEPKHQKQQRDCSRDEDQVEESGRYFPSRHSGSPTFMKWSAATL